MVNNVDTVDPRELQTLQVYLNEYRQQAEIFSQQLGMLEEGRMEAHAAIEALKGLMETGESTVLLQIGGGVSVRAKVSKPDEVLVNIGAEVIVQRSSQEAVDYLTDRITEMEASSKKVAETLGKVQSQMNEIARRLEIGYQMSQMPPQAQAAAPRQAEE
jgi:prefoldin alpha subunit